MATSGYQRSWVHIHSIIPRALRQRATHIINMAVGPEEGGKLAHGRLQPALPVRAKTRRQNITPDGTPGLLCLSNPGRRQTAIFPFLKLKTFNSSTRKFRVSGTFFNCRRPTIIHCVAPTALLAGRAVESWVVVNFRLAATVSSSSLVHSAELGSCI
jgi:hypothetical protein